MKDLKKILFDYLIKIDKQEKIAINEYKACFKDFKPIVSDDILKEKFIEKETTSARYNVLFNILNESNLIEEYESYYKSQL